MIIDTIYDVIKNALNVDGKKPLCIVLDDAELKEMYNNEIDYDTQYMVPIGKEKYVEGYLVVGTINGVDICWSGM